MLRSTVVICFDSDVDYTTGSSENILIYCIEPCQSHVEPVQRNPSPDFCYHLYKGSLFESIFSYLSFIPNAIEETARGFADYIYCPADVINADGACPSPQDSSGSRTMKGCRPDGKGDWSLPPGGSLCLIFLNGHDWPVGATLITAATFYPGTPVLGCSEFLPREDMPL